MQRHVEETACIVNLLMVLFLWGNFKLVTPHPPFPDTWPNIKCDVHHNVTIHGNATVICIEYFWSVFKNLVCELIVSSGQIS